MRVKMGEVIDVTKDFSMRNLSIQQKVSAIVGATVADSKILGKRKKDREEAIIRKRGEAIDSLKDGILATVQFYLIENRAISQYNQKAKFIEVAISREHEEILPIVFESKEFNLMNVEYVQLDSDLVNSFGNVVPIIVKLSKKEM
jgi:hypothetical protein